jgi:hypothetical protein
MRGLAYTVKKRNNSLGVEDVDSFNSIVSCSSSDLKRVAGTRLVTIESVGTLWLVEIDELGLATGASSRAESGWTGVDKMSRTAPE